MINVRLRDERQRLKCTRPVFAMWVGVHTRTVADWETGKSSPTAVHLSKLATHGIDVQYVITGERSEPVSIDQTLLSDEIDLLEDYRRTNRAGRSLITSVAAFCVDNVQDVNALSP